MLSLVAQTLIQVVDTAFLGRVGEVELGASALAGIVYIAVFTLGFGFSMGSQIMIGRRNGERNFSEIGGIVVQGFAFLLVLALIFIPILKILSPSLLPKFFSSEDVTVAVIEYLDWRVYGFVFSFTNSIFRAFFVGIARTKVLTMNAIVMGLVNVFFDYGLIFGHFGMPEMGIGGAALASVIAEASSTLFFFIYLLKTVDLEKYGFKRIRWKWSVTAKVLSISIYMMVQNLLAVSTWLLFFVFIERLGERPLAVSNIVRSFSNLFTIPSAALGAVANTLVSNTIGANRSDEVLPLVKCIAGMSFGVMLVVIILALVFPELIARIYTDDQSLINDTITPLYVLVLSLPFFSVSTVFFSAVSGTGNTKRALTFEVFTLTFYLFYIWLIISHLKLSVAWAWTSELLYWMFLAILSYLYLKRGKWKNKQI